ncbi:hypothetical protein L2E82_17311 [Cichorium intybus]|uniref:Uncharacterized protein n=1 Tax=Cichorium intybus TaxID=13427 RepID=A0ACB9F8W1_CICIN|nr:hypothetical protein L2E82_17311 [Cichorium intybus]
MKGSSLDANIPDPGTVPLPNSPKQPNEPNSTYKAPDINNDILGPPNFTAISFNEPSRCNLGNSSKQRKLNKSSRPTVYVSMNPRNLVDDFDLNVAVSNHSASCNRLEYSSSSSIEVKKIIQIGNRVGFKIDDGAYGIVDEVLGKIPSGEEHQKEHRSLIQLKKKVDELEMEAERRQLSDAERAFWRDDKAK